VTRRIPAVAGALVGAAVAGSVTTIALWGNPSTAAAPAAPATSTATVVRTNLATTTLTEGTLGYAPSSPVVNHVSGVYTALPSPGTTIRPGDVLYRVDNEPVVLMSGVTPAWRPLAPGVPDGPDVTELEAGLIAGGDAAGLLATPTAHFSAATAAAVERWQTANGLGASGQVPFGQVVFLPGPVLVGAVNSSVGQSASPGDQPFAVSTTTRTVSLPLNAALPPVTVGEAVSIVLPTTATTPGTVTAIEPASSGESSASPAGGGASNGSSGAGSGQPAISTIATVAPDHPDATGTAAGIPVQVTLVTQSASDVLAVPVAALLALSGGGYGVEVVEPRGGHHLVAVTTGIFSGSQVQVTGAGVDLGTRVVVAQ